MLCICNKKSIKVFLTRINPGTTQSGTHGSMNTIINVNPDTTLSVSILVPYRYGWRGIRAIQFSNTLPLMSIRTWLYLYQYLFALVMVDEAKELFSLVILYYQWESGHDFICIDSESISFFQENDSRDSCLLTNKNYSHTVIKAKSNSNWRVFRYLCCRLS